MDFKKKQKFSIRKLTLGAASVLLGTSLVLGSAEAKAEEVATELSGKAEEKVKIGYLALNEKELNEIEKELIIREDISKEKAIENDTYVVVYKPKEEIKNVLPNTGISQNIINLILAGGLLVLVYRLGNKKSTLIGIAILTTVSGLGLNNAQAEEVLRSIANQVKVHEKTNNLEKLNIENYDYVGYIRDEEIPANTRLKEIVENYKIEQGINIKNEEITSEKPDEVIPEVQPGNPELDPMPQPEEPSKPELEPTPELKKPEVEPTPQPEEPKSEIPNNYPTVEEKPEFDVSKLEKPKEPELEPTPEEPKSEVPNSYPTVEEKPEFDVSKLEKPKEPEVEPAPQPEEPKSEVPNSYPTVEEKPTFEIPKSETSTREIPYGTTYVGDEEKEYGSTNDVIKPGVNGIETTTTSYGVTDSGEIIKNKPVVEVTQPSLNQIEKVGTKPKVETEEIPYTTEYRENENAEYGTDTEKEGEVGRKETKTTYELNTSTGEITSIVGEPKLIKEPTNKVVTKGTKPKVATEDIPYTTEYRANEDAEYGTDTEKEGEVGTKETKTTYELNTSTGEITSIVGEPKLIKEPINKVVTKGTKPKVEEVPIKFETIYEEDNTLYVGEEVIEGGEEGSKRITTTYSLNTENGEITANKPTEEILKEAVNKIIKQGTKQKEKPTININTFDNNEATNNTIILDKEVDNKVVVGLSFTNEDSITNKKYRLYKNNELVSESNFAEDLNLTNLEHDTPYRLEAIAEYNFGDGVQEVKDTKKFTLELKKIEIKDIKEYRIFKKGTDNKPVRILNFDYAPNDLENYYVEVVSDINKPILLPIKNIEESGDKFKIITDTVDLVEKRGDIYEKGHDFEISKLNKVANQIYSFRELLESVKANPSGEFVLGSSITASEINDTTTTYITETFLGKIIGNGNTIYDLVKPLFDTVKGATIENVELKDVNIYTTEKNIGSLARTAENATINNVDVSGKIAAQGVVGGLVATSKNTNYTDVSFRGTIKNTHPVVNDKDSSILGGIVGDAASITLNKGYVDANLQLAGKSNRSKAGGILGKGSGKINIDNVTVKGNLINRGNTAQIGGLAGSLWGSNGTINNSVSLMKVKNGNILYGDSGDKAVRFKNVSVVEGVSTGNSYANAHNNISLSEAAAKEKEQGVTLPEESVLFKTQYDNNLLHKNIEKLIPFYNQSQIKKYANKLSSNTDFNSKEIISVVPMDDNNILTSFKDKNSVNKIMIHFADGTVSYYTLQYLENFNDYLPEYKVVELDVIYTPNAFVENNDSLVKSLVESFKNIDTTSLEFAKKIYFADNSTTADVAKTRLKELYLDESFAAVKENIADILKDILVSDKMINLSSNTISEVQLNKIKENKEYILTGLAYLKKWYPIKFGNINIGELVINHQNFFGKNVGTIDFLIDIGKGGLEELKSSKNLAMYDRSIGFNSNHNNLFSYLEDMKNKFTNYKDMNTWFKNDTNVYGVETDIGPDDSIKANFYDQITRENSIYNPYLLPLLTAKEGIFTMTTPGSIAFGMYDTYMDMGLKDTDPDKYASEKARVEGLMDRQLKHQKIHLNFWYNMLPEEHKHRLIKDNPIWDGYRVKNSWLTKDNPNQAMKDFFLPIDRYYSQNNTGAYSDFTQIYYSKNRILEDYGSALYAHEMMHNNDGGVYFLGTGRRNGLYEEYYALGMIQPSHTAVHDAFTLNTMYDFSKDKNNDLRTQNIDPARINTDEKLQDYMRKTFDVIYTLDYAEAEVLLSKTSEDRKKWYTQMTTTEENNYGTMLPLNVRVELPDNINLQNINDLIDNEIVSKHGYKVGNRDHLNYTTSNGYYYAYLFRPIYGSGESEVGTAGDIMFRRIAFELLAYKGYNKGMLPYLSNVLKDEAKKQGENKIKDSLVISKVSEGKYNTIKEFKKEMFAERYKNRNKLKAITINYKGSSYTLNGYDEIKNLLNQVISDDLKLGTTNYEQVKNKIFTAYLNLTNDFEEEIYN